MTRRPGHEEENHPLRLRGEVGVFRSQRIQPGRLARAEYLAFAKKRAQGDGAQTYAAFLEEPAAGDVFAIVVKEMFVPGHRYYSFVMVSSRLSNTRETTV